MKKLTMITVSLMLLGGDFAFGQKTFFRTKDTAGRKVVLSTLSTGTPLTVTDTIMILKIIEMEKALKSLRADIRETKGKTENIQESLNSLGTDAYKTKVDLENTKDDLEKLNGVVVRDVSILNKNILRNDTLTAQIGSNFQKHKSRASWGIATSLALGIIGTLFGYLAYNKRTGRRIVDENATE